MTGPDPKPPAIPRDRLMAETRLTALRAELAEKKVRAHPPTVADRLTGCRFCSIPDLWHTRS